MAGLLRLRMAMTGTLSFIITISTLFFAAIMLWTGAFIFLGLVFIVVIFNLAQ